MRKQTGNASDYSKRVTETFNKADADGVSGLSLREFEDFYFQLKDPESLGDKNYYQVTGDTTTGFTRDVPGYAKQNMLERMYGAWEAMGGKDNITLSDWNNLEATVAGWLSAGKMDQTGFAY